MLSEINQTQKDKYFMFFLKCRYAESKHTRRTHNTHICIYRERESRRLGKEKLKGKGGREGAGWEERQMFSDM